MVESDPRRRLLEIGADEDGRCEQGDGEPRAGPDGEQAGGETPERVLESTAIAAIVSRLVAAPGAARAP